MDGIRELHAQDPEKWTKDALSERFGISYEAVGRILRSNYRRDTTSAKAGTAEMGKWSRAADGVNSPVPNIRAVYGLKRADEEAAREARKEERRKGE